LFQIPIVKHIKDLFKSFLFYFFSQPKKSPWIFEACKFDESEGEQDFVKCKNTLN
jgi:hypothetical protein